MKLDSKNKKLSIILLGKSKKYYIYKFKPNGYFDPDARQPIVKKIEKTVEDPEL
jgi:hypothetical protein